MRTDDVFRMVAILACTGAGGIAGLGMAAPTWLVMWAMGWPQAIAVAPIIVGLLAGVTAGWMMVR